MRIYKFPWTRKDEGDLNYWAPMRVELEKNLFNWDNNNINKKNNSDVNEVVANFNLYINNALSNSLTVNNFNNNKRTRSNRSGILIYLL